MTYDQAIAELKTIMKQVGLGYHPDTMMGDYVKAYDYGDIPSFTIAECEDLEHRHGRVWDVLKDDIYSLALKEIV